MTTRTIAATAVAAFLLASCSSPPPPPEHSDRPWHPPSAMLLPYAAPDGTLTRAQMEAGLHRDFDKADTNHDGCLDPDQVRVINEQRWKADASTASPLIDFKHNNCVDFDEFAATPRNVFQQLDRKGAGKLTAQELKPGSKAGTKSDQDSDHHHHDQSDGGPG